MKQAFITSAAIVQLVALLLLQCYPIAAQLGHKPARPQCTGDHAQCGCAPERIASRSCCCYRHKPACCDPDRHHDEECDSQRDKGPASPHLSAAPCGSTPKFTTASLEKLKFIRHEALLTVPAAQSPSYLPAGPETAPSRCAEPPEPPPKLFLLA